MSSPESPTRPPASASENTPPPVGDGTAWPTLGKWCMDAARGGAGEGGAGPARGGERSRRSREGGQRTTESENEKRSVTYYRT